MIKTFAELVENDKVPVYNYSKEWLPGGKYYEEEHMKEVTFTFEEEGNRAVHNDWDSENFNNCNYLILKDGKPIAIANEYECEDMAMQKGNLIILQGHDATSFFDIATGEFSREYTR